MKVISSRDNRYIKECFKLKQRKYRESGGIFLVEGLKMLEEALAFSPAVIKYVLIDESIEHLELPQISGQVFLVNHKLMQEISDTETPQGIVAVVEKPYRRLDDLIKDNSLLVLLDGVADPGNMGTIMRTAWAFDAGGILLTKGCVDPFSPKAVRSSMGGIFNLPIIENITISDIEDLQKSGFQLISTAIKAPICYCECDYTRPSIITIGNEAHGISQEIGQISNALISIPINPRVDSLNAGVACGIILSEVRKQKDC